VTSVLFGRTSTDLEKGQLLKLREHRSLYKDQLPERWGEIPESDQRKLSKAVFLAIYDYRNSDPFTSFLAEWDTVEVYSFRDHEFWIARTERAHVTFKERNSPWLVFLEGGASAWPVAGRIGRVLFDSSRGIVPFVFTTDILRSILQADSRGERYMWWRGVEGDMDGALKGPNLPRGKGFRHRFDIAGAPYFARFESKTLNKQVSISCKHGSIGGLKLSASEATAYFEAYVLPHLGFSSTK
jgi:hypothetical protein